MSSCPENDIHSIYLDNELPLSYRNEYESHLKTCEKCRSQLEKMRVLHKMFVADDASLGVDEIYMAQSYERLKARLSYSKVIKTKKKSSLSYGITAVAAAAAVAFFVPLGIKVSGGSVNVTAATGFEPVAKTELVSPANASYRVEGNIDDTSIRRFFGDQSAVANQGAQTVSYGFSGASHYRSNPDPMDVARVRVPAGESFVYDNSSENTIENFSFADYDVFSTLPPPPRRRNAGGPGRGFSRYNPPVIETSIPGEEN